MKKALSLILLMSILFVMIVSCNKTTDEKGNDTDVSTSNNTDVSTTIRTTYIVDETEPPSEDEYQNNNILSFISEWKKQQSVSENEDTRYDWKSIDGSPESSLLLPIMVPEEYVFAEAIPGYIDSRDNHRAYAEYYYGYYCEKEDYYNGVAIYVVKGNRNYDMFYKEELSNEDLEFFIKEFVIREGCDCYSCKREQNRTNISMQTDNAVCVEYPAGEDWFMLYEGQIVFISLNDKSLIDSPDDIFDYVTFVEITID